MAIAPISSIGHKNYTKNIHFEARNKENKGSSNLRNTAMAVPLATLLAMSPLNPVDARINDRFEDNSPKIELFDFSEIETNPQTIKSMPCKTEKKSWNKDTNSELKLVDTDGNKANFEGIMLTNNAVIDMDLKCKYNHNFTIYSDDATVGNKFKLYSYCFEEPESEEYQLSEMVTDSQAKKFIEDALKSPANNNVTLKEITAHPSLRFDVASEKFVRARVLNRPIPNTMKNAKPYDFSSSGIYKNIGSQEFQGDNGKYQFTYYSYGNREKIDVVSIKKNGGPELFIQKNIIGKLLIKDSNGSKQQDVDYGCAIVVDGNGKEYALVDLLLSRALVLIAQDSQTSGVCYDCVQHNRECEYLTKGQLNDLSGEK